MKVLPPRKRTSLGNLSRQANTIAKDIKKLCDDSGMNKDAELLISASRLRQLEVEFKLLGSQLDSMYQEECKRKGK